MKRLLFAIQWHLRNKKGFLFAWKIYGEMHKAQKKMVKDLIYGSGKTAEMRGLDAIIEDKYL